MTGEYVVIFRDQWDETSISFVLGPCASLEDAQETRNHAEKRIGSSYRFSSIEKCRDVSNLPEWEIAEEQNDMRRASEGGDACVS